jgi:hypothetical protein
MRLFVCRVFGALASVCVLSSSVVFAQEISGVVKDASGAVLPGVTVEASSPVLIEKVRTAVSDDAGRYRIVQLRPGIYVVTFTLAGFSPFKREGIELTADFTATVNGEMRVGAISETVTVTGESPIVDVQSVTTRTVMTRDVLDAIPTGHDIQAVGVLIPGTTLQRGGGNAYSVDVGGSGGMQQSPLVYHGNNNSVQQVNGIRYNNLCGSGQYAGTYWNLGMFQEISYVTSADSAENGQGGIRINMVPKEGGNTFRGTVFGNFTYDPWQANNLDSHLTSRGLQSVAHIDKIWDFNPSFGGPIIRDRLWFQATYRYWGVNQKVAGSFSEIDPTQPGVDDSHINSRVVHLAWQASPKNKVTGYFDLNQKYRGHWGIDSLTSPEASAIEDMPNSFTNQVKWLSTMSNKLLFEAGFGVYYQEYREIYRPPPENPLTPDSLRTVTLLNGTPLTYRPYFTTQDLTTGQYFGSFRQFNVDHFSTVYNYLATLSYVTGSHAIKTGVSFGNGVRHTNTNARGDIIVRYFNGQPNSVVLQNTPRLQDENVNADLGIYAQDKWTIARATLSLGVRFDYFNSEVPAQVKPAGTFVGARTFDPVPNVPNWKDISPRLGVSYDLLGNNKTALKFGFNRYVAGVTAGFAGFNNPYVVAGGATDTRSWNDANGDHFPDPSEFGASGNAAFGSPVPIITTRYDDSVKSGWFKRGYSWDASAALQQQLSPRVSAEFDFHRGWINGLPFGIAPGIAGVNFLGSQLVTVNNLKWTPADFDAFCVAVPNNPALPNAGQPLCGLYDITLAKRPQVDNVVQRSSDFGDRSLIYTGFDLSVNARLANGALVSGGVTSGRTASQDCVIVNNPAFINYGTSDRGYINALGPRARDCQETPPFLPNYKFLWAYPLPYGLQFAGAFQSVPGPEITAQYLLSAANTIGLGRAPTPGTFAALIKPGTQYDERMYHTDFSLTKSLRFGRTRVRAVADLYNVFNNNAVLGRNNVYGPAWGRPDQVLQARMFKLGAGLDF